MLGWIEDDLLIEMPVTNPSKITCFNYASDKFQKNEIACPSTASAKRDNAFTFTFQSQKNLFNGNTLTHISDLP